MPKLLIAVDGSDCANRAIEVAGRLAQAAPQTEVVLLNVRDPSYVLGESVVLDVQSVDEAMRQSQERLLEAAQAHARACGLEHVTTQAEVGVPAAEIVRAAEERAVDQIVVGTRGRSSLAGLMLGSVAQRVAHLAHVPVLVVK